ncbi:hypothetical protein NRI_0325 [Neorickettsia risticii str. Illinois]|uniref:Uncharacterized protein n=1 Tax=Neorickettsia risticii (strain Illinois) TaxID=434131 RepID=C6V4J5_NEORI|nr:hypothetical protein NRI_0325 [Neorickettsia risticii str. Illinois]
MIFLVVDTKLNDPCCFLLWLVCFSSFQDFTRMCVRISRLVE